MNTRFKTLRLILSMIFDSVVIYGVYLLAFYIRERVHLPFTEKLLPESRFEVVKHYYLLMIAMHLVVMYFFGIYERVWKKYFWDTLKYLFIPSIIGTLLLISVYFFRGNVYFPRSIFIIFPLLTMVCLNIWRNIAARLRKTGVRKIIVVGVNHDSLNLFSTFIEHFEGRVKVIGVIAFSKTEIDDNKAELDALGVNILGEISDIKKILKGTSYDELILTPESDLIDRYINDISKIRTTGVSMFALPGAYEILLGKLNHTVVHDIPMVHISNPTNIETRIVKRTVDIVLALLLLTIFSPFLLISAILVRLTSKGPIIYKQRRVGRGGKGFTIYKFRSMVVDAEANGAQLAEENDPRVTKFGSFMRSTRLDELPQLFNIIIGNMSFVGPRPERKEFVRDFIKSISAYRERFRVKPGVTGLAQIRGEYFTNARIKLKYDLAYIANYSIWLDIKILLETVKVVLTRKGA